MSGGGILQKSTNITPIGIFLQPVDYSNVNRVITVMQAEALAIQIFCKSAISCGLGFTRTQPVDQR